MYYNINLYYNYFMDYMNNKFDCIVVGAGHAGYSSYNMLRRPFRMGV